MHMYIHTHVCVYIYIYIACRPARRFQRPGVPLCGDDGLILCTCFNKD